MAMKKFLILILCATLVIFSGFAVALESSKVEPEDVAVTATAATVTLTTTSKSLALINDGANSIFVRFGATATADGDASLEIKAGEAFTFNDFRVASMSVVCTAGQTSTLRVESTY
jgi:hypothetical protein